MSKNFAASCKGKWKKALFGMCTDNPTEGGKLSNRDTKADLIAPLNANAILLHATGVPGAYRPPLHYLGTSRTFASCQSSLALGTTKSTMLCRVTRGRA